MLILDFGSQYTQLIARRIRELHVYCEIHPYLMPLEQIRKFAPRGIVLSGGPRSVYETAAPLVGREVLELGVPVLGICYGLQLINHILGGSPRPPPGSMAANISLFRITGISLPVWVPKNWCG